MNRMLEQKRLFSHKNDAQSVANGDRRRVEIELRQCIFIDPGVEIDET